MRGEKELNSIIEYGHDSNKQTGHGEDYNLLTADEVVYCWFCNLQYKVISISRNSSHLPFHVVCSFRGALSQTVIYQIL